MTTATSQAYQHLHTLLKQLHDVDQMLAHGPRRIGVARKKVAAAEQACADQKEQIQSLKKSADQSSLNLKSREAEIEKLVGRLNQASSNKEYDIIQTQLAAEKAADAELEDCILTLLSQVDEADEELADREAEKKTMEVQLTEIEAVVSAKEPGLQADAARLTEEITEAEKIIPGGESAGTYGRLRLSQGAAALAALEDGYCAECNTVATQQDVVRMNLGEFVLCRACGRVLYQNAAAED